jgi:hypothetical protein
MLIICHIGRNTESATSRTMPAIAMVIMGSMMVLIFFAR